MIPENAFILLDTNIQLIRKNIVSQQLESDYKLISRPNGNLISYVTLGEIYALSLKFDWGKPRRVKRELKISVQDINFLSFRPEGEILKIFCHFDQREKS
jgi:hypothetical protein